MRKRHEAVTSRPGRKARTGGRAAHAALSAVGVGASTGGLEAAGPVVDGFARRLTDLALLRTDRTLRVLTHANRALIRAESEQDLLKEACRIVVEIGGYRMAWVGYAEHDARRSVRPMAMVGFPPGVPAGSTVTWADTPSGRGSVGSAIRSGRPCVCRNAGKDPLPVPWRRCVLKRGCASALALPLLTEHGCLGVLTIYATQVDAFDESEVQLFEQLAGDLSFGIKALCDRAERKELERQVLDVSEREQRRIGQDLHDGVGQSLAGIRYLLSDVQQSLARRSAPEAAELDRLTRMVGTTVRQVHDMAQGLFPGDLKRTGIADALQELAMRTQGVFGIACRFTGSADLRLADPHAASQVYRIAQEAVANAAKHSKGKRIEISLVQSRGRPVLTVRDTGRGIGRPAGRAGGMGHRIMKYRADTIGAILKIESSRGQGTTVTCVLPSQSRPYGEIPS